MRGRRCPSARRPQRRAAKVECERLELDRAKARRRQIESFMQWSKSEEIKAALSSGATNAEKLEILGRAMYGEEWDT